MNLYVAMIGGQLPGHRLEVHDIEIHLAEDESAFIAQCRVNERPIKARHLDGWIVIPLDGAGSSSLERLYLVEVGKNEAGRFFELHDYLVISATDTRAAVRAAKERTPGWHVDTIIDLSRAASEQGQSVNAIAAQREAKQVSRYIRF